MVLLLKIIEYFKIFKPNYRFRCITFLFIHNQLISSSMCKKNFVLLAKGKKSYRLYSEDISGVHKIIQKKRPAIPRF